MNWKTKLLEFASIGLFFVALWIPFRMGRAGIRNLWCILVGWFVLAGLMVALAILPLCFGNNGGALDSNLADALPDGQAAVPYLLFGWAIAWGAAAIGRKSKKLKL